MVRPQYSHRGWLLALVAIVSGPVAAKAAAINVSPGELIQAAMVAATDGDTVLVSAGTYDEDIDFLGKEIALVGAGYASVIRGTGGGPVVTLATGEGPDSVLDSFTITGGVADRGGGIFVQGSSPTIVCNMVFLNQARFQGSGIYIEGSSAEVYNNLVIYNITTRLPSIRIRSMSRTREAPIRCSTIWTARAMTSGSPGDPLRRCHRLPRRLAIPGKSAGDRSGESTSETA